MQDRGGMAGFVDIHVREKRRVAARGQIITDSVHNPRSSSSSNRFEGAQRSSSSLKVNDESRALSALKRVSPSRGA